MEYKYHPIVASSGSKETRENFNLCPKSLEKTLHEMKKPNTIKTSLDTNILEDWIMYKTAIIAILMWFRQNFEKMAHSLAF